MLAEYCDHHVNIDDCVVCAFDRGYRQAKTIYSVREKKLINDVGAEIQKAQALVQSETLEIPEATKISLLATLKKVKQLHDSF